MALLDPEELRGLKMQGLFQGLMGLGGGLLAQGQGNPNGLLQGVGALNQSMDPRRIAMMQQAKIAELQATMQMDQMKRQQAQQEAYRTSLLGGPASTGGAGGDQVAMQPGLLDQMNVSPIVRAMAQADPSAVGGGLLAQAMKPPEHKVVGNSIVEMGNGPPKAVFTAPEPDTTFMREAAKFGLTPEQAREVWIRRQTKPTAEVNLGGEKAFSTEYSKGIAERLLKSRDDAKSAISSLEANNEARAILERGTIGGFGADWRLAVAKGLYSIGLSEGEDARNTDQFVAAVARNTVATVRQLGSGSGISNADLAFAKQVSGGDLNIDPKGARRILDMNDRVTTAAIKKHNTEAALFKNSPLIPEDLRSTLSVEMPTLQPPPAPTAAPPAATPQAAGPRPTATGADGKKYVLSPDGKSWVEVK